MNKLFDMIKKHLIFILIVLLPIWDIITYFLIDSKFGIVLTFSRFLLAGIIFVYSFIISKSKKHHYIFSLIMLIYILGHIISCYISGYINIYEDVANLFRILYMPILLFSFIIIFKSKPNAEKDIKNGMIAAFFIVIISIILSLITNSANYTYGEDLSLGVIGWFYNKNTQSLILVLLAMICGAYTLKSKKYYFTAILIFLALYFNATKTAYISLLAFLLFALFYSIFEVKSKKKILYNIILLVFAIGLFQYSPTYNNNLLYATEQSQKNDTNDNNSNINKNPNSDDIGDETNPPEFIITPPTDSLRELETLYRTYSLGTLIDEYGIKKVAEKYNYTQDAFILSNTRTKKRIAASLIYDEENTLSHLFGFEFTKINSLTNKKGITEINDLENDFTALFYYCGFVGIGLYFAFILYFLIKIIKEIFVNPKYIFKSEYMIWLCLIGLLLFGAEYTGALLRRPNANIYLSIIIAITYVKFTTKERKTMKNKISFLMLHLGYGGIETATINTANELAKKYNVEIISLYNLKNNQENLISKDIKITHLMNTSPNKKEFLEAYNNKNISKILKEGVKSLKIIVLKPILIRNYIQESDSKIIVSTRSEFSRILSKYKRKEAIAIAQEHHHHNNNKKYLNVLKKKYKNIDYLFALTDSLLKDYENLLVKNKKIKIILMPNILSSKNEKRANFNSKNLISVGRLHPDKRVGELVDIISNVKNFSNFFIIGDGEEYSQIDQRINELNLQNKIKMLGYKTQEEIKEYYSNSTIFIMASISEGLPMVLLEAMSYGIPCIAYKISGVEDIIINDYNGYLIEPRNQKEFIKKIEYLLSNEKEYKRLEENAYITSKKYYPEVIIKKWYEILDQYL